MNVGKIRVAVHRDNGSNARWVRSLGDPNRNIIVVDLLDHTAAKLLDVADAVLDGMGKSEDITTVKRRCEPLTAAWLRSSAQPVVVIADAQLLAPPAAAEAAVWLSGHGADVWLACATRSPQHPNAATVATEREVRSAAGAERVTESAFRDAFKGHASRRPAVTPPPEDWPRLPRVDGFVFRDACKRLLSPRDFRRVDAAFVTRVERIFESLPEPFSEPARARKTWPMLAAEIRSSSSLEDLVLTIRAAQVALLPRCWFLAVDTATLVGAAHTTPRTGEFDANAAWSALDTYRDPDAGAVASLYLAGLDPTLIRHLRVGDVDEPEDITAPLTFRTAEGPVVVQNGGARFVRTLATYRRLCGATRSAPLFESHRGPGLSHRRLNQLLQIPSAEVGVVAARGRVHSAQPTPAQYCQRFGLTLQWIGGNRF